MYQNWRFNRKYIENRSILIENRYRRFDQIVEIRIDDNSTFESGFQIWFDDVDSIRESESHLLSVHYLVHERSARLFCTLINHIIKRHVLWVHGHLVWIVILVWTWLNIWPTSLWRIRFKADIWDFQHVMLYIRAGMLRSCSRSFYFKI